MGESSEVTGEPVSWKQWSMSSALTQVLAAEEEEEEVGGAIIWPNTRSGEGGRRTNFLCECVLVGG